MDHRKRERKRETPVFCILDQNVDICNSHNEKEKRNTIVIFRQRVHAHARTLFTRT